MFNKPPTKDDLKVGMLIIWEERVSDFHTKDRWCKVVKLTDKGTVTIKYGEKEKQLRSYGDLRIPTEHEIAMRRWRGTRPEHKLINVSMGDVWGHGNGDRVTIELHLASDGTKHEGTFEEQLRAAKTELEAYADWYAKKPVSSE